jgi:hypothetical protein
MDLGNIVYVVAVIAYFIYQMTRKKKEGESADDSGNPSEAPPKGLTFEELLKEIRNAQNPVPTNPEPIQPTVPKPVVAQSAPSKSPNRRPVAVEEEDDEITRYEGSFEGTKKNPYLAYQNIHSIPSTPAKRIEYDSLNPKKVNPFAELLKNPKSLKQAIIVSEILKPKHF